ncbi:hypothetical protein C2G38_2088253 [Gigaspora rosea]|uniref:Uncharacterized protein n=1 Tax=Gigaspora rosea TaxID=44941 RepID=A0A397V4V9_9GLOM|nr:hypothetical protein C2G38_2088253 [Gigaspora rosea]
MRNNKMGKKIMEFFNFRNPSINDIIRSYGRCLLIVYSHGDLFIKTFSILIIFSFYF